MALIKADSNTGATPARRRTGWNGTGFSSLGEYMNRGKTPVQTGNTGGAGPYTAGAGAAADTVDDTDAAAQGAPYVAPRGQYDDLEGDVLGKISEGLKGPSDPLQTLFRQGSESVATNARQLQASAGARVAKTGAIGQGTQGQEADAVGSDVLSQISENAMNNSLLAGKENQDFLAQARDVVQNEQQNQRQYEQTLAGLAANNPTLSGKLTQYLMTGGSGAIGDFNPAEQAEIAQWVKDNKEKADAIDKATGGLISGISNDVANTQTGATIAGTADWSTIDWKSPANQQYVKNLPNTGIGAIGNPSTFAKANLGKPVKIDGDVYRVDQAIQGRYNRGDRHRDVMKLTKQDGTVVYMRNDGKTTTTPLADTSSPTDFAEWYDSMS